MDCTIRVAKTKALISFAVTAKLICVFVFAYAKSRFSHNAAHIFQLPTNLLRAGRVFTFEPPPGVSANLLRTFSTIPATRMCKVRHSCLEILPICFPQLP